MRDSEITICRCEDISLDEIRKTIADGYDDFEELKRFLRVGMGPCGGRTCIPLIRRELANYKNIPLSEVEVPTVRPPMQVTTFAAIADGSEGGHNG